MPTHIMLVTFFYQWDQNTETPIEEVYRLQEELLKNESHLVTFHVNILVSLWTFQLTVVLDLSNFVHSHLSYSSLYFSQNFYYIK